MRVTIQIAPRLVAFAALLMLLPAVNGAAQEATEPGAEQNPAPDELTFAETVEVNVVNLYVTVVDRKGRPVTGLSAADFEVVEDGQPVEITNFSAIGSVATGSVEAVDAVAQGEDVAPRGTTAGLSASSHLAVVFDNPGLEKRQRKRVLKALYPWVQSVTANPSEILVATLEPRLKILQPFTANPALVLSAFDEVAQRDSQGDMNKSRKRVLVRNMQSAPSMKREANIYEPPEITPGGTNPGGSSSGGTTSTTLPTGLQGIPGADSQQAMQYLNQIEMYRRQEYVRIGESLAGIERLLRGLSGLPGKKDVLWVTEDLMIQPGVDVYSVFFNHFAGASQDLNFDQPQIWGHELELVREFQYIAGLSQIAGTMIHVVDASDRDREAASADYKTSELSAFDSANSSGSGATGGYDLSTSRSQTDGGLYLASATGGTFFGSSRKFDDHFEKLSDLFSAYYSIGYRSPDPPDGSLHDVSVRVRRDDLKVRTHERVPSPTRDQALANVAVSRLMLDAGMNPHGLRVELGPTEPAEGDRYIQEVRLQIPASTLMLEEEGPNQVGRVAVAVVAADPEGNPMPPRLLQLAIQVPTDRMAPGLVTLSRLRLMMEEGSTALAVAIRDEATGTESSGRASSGA